MHWLQRILGDPAHDIAPQVMNRSQHATKDDSRVAAARCARHSVYAGWGRLLTRELAPLPSPATFCSPRWPAGHATWRVVETDTSTIVVSDGLSDPFVEENIPGGYQVEVCAETPGRFAEIADSWLFELVHEVAQLVAGCGDFVDLLAQHPCIATVMELPTLPEHLKDADGQSGALVGLPTPRFPQGLDLPDGPVRLLPIKLLTPQELEYVISVDGDEDRRQQLAAHFAGPQGHLSLLNRPSVV